MKSAGEKGNAETQRAQRIQVDLNEFLRASVSSAAKKSLPRVPLTEFPRLHHNRAFTLRALDNFFAEAFRVETFLICDEKVFHTGKSFVLGC